MNQLELSEISDNISIFTTEKEVQNSNKNVDIKVIAPIENHIKVFNSPEEFNHFYNKNKAEIDKTSTYKLNKLFKIKGYHIYRLKKKELVVKKLDENKLTKENIAERFNELDNTIDELETRMEEIKNSVNKIIMFLNTGVNESQLEEQQQYIQDESQYIRDGRYTTQYERNAPQRQPQKQNGQWFFND